MLSKLSVLSYNLCFNKALPEFADLVAQYRPDVICVQEFNVNEGTVGQIEKLGYELADYSYSFSKYFKMYSVATFYNPQVLKHQNGVAISLSKGVYELILYILRLGRTERTALTNTFAFKENPGKSIRICNIHLTAMQSSNKLRAKQLKTTLTYLNHETKVATLVVGDFNYMYKRKFLERIFTAEGYREATDNLFYTFEWNILWLFKFRTKPDYFWYKGLKKHQTTRLSRKYSDHFPVLGEFRI